ncbi:MAG: hypothetical protein KF809_08885 [Chloroflexi bacterium]|nr:hypothetical protein [Chloroflexota bacterium]
MPANAYGLLALFLVLSVIIGAGVSVMVGPRRPGRRGVLLAILPILGAVIAFDWIGHRSGLELGPTVELLGYRVAIVQDVIAGFIGAFVVAIAQRLVLDRRSGSASTPGAADGAGDTTG